MSRVMRVVLRMRHVMVTELPAGTEVLSASLDTMDGGLAVVMIVAQTGEARRERRVFQIVRLGEAMSPVLGRFIATLHQHPAIPDVYLFEHVRQPDMFDRKDDGDGEESDARREAGEDGAGAGGTEEPGRGVQDG